MSEQEQERRARLVEENHALRERVTELKRANDKLIRDKAVVYARVLELEEEDAFDQPIKCVADATAELEQELGAAREELNKSNESLRRESVKTGRLERELADARDVCDAGWMRADEIEKQLAEQLAEQLPQPSERGKAMIERARAAASAEVAAHRYAGREVHSRPLTREQLEQPQRVVADPEDSEDGPDAADVVFSDAQDGEAVWIYQPEDEAAAAVEARVCKTCRFYGRPVDGSLAVCTRFRMHGLRPLDPDMVAEGEWVPEWCPGWVERTTTPLMSIRIGSAPPPAGRTVAAGLPPAPTEAVATSDTPEDDSTECPYEDCCQSEPCKREAGCDCGESDCVECAKSEAADTCAICHRAMHPDDLRACSGQDDPGGPCVPVSVAKVRGWR